MRSTFSDILVSPGTHEFYVTARRTPKKYKKKVLCVIKKPSVIIPSITPKIIEINYFLHILDFNSGIDSYQITSMFDITLNINDRVAVIQDPTDP